MMTTTTQRIRRGGLAMLVMIAGLAVMNNTAGRAHAQTSTPASMPKDDLFAGTEKFAKNASDVTELNMDPQTLNKVSGHDASRAHRMVLNVVRTYEYDKPGMYDIADVEAIRNRLNTGDWHCSVHTRDMKHGESTDICNRSRTDGLVETAIITVEPKELTFIHTIKQGSGGGEWPGGMGLTGLSPMESGSGALQAEMAIMRAQMAETQAEMGPQMRAQMREQMAEAMPNMRSMATGLGPLTSTTTTHTLTGMHDFSYAVPPVQPVPPVPPVPAPPATVPGPAVPLQ